MRRWRWLNRFWPEPDPLSDFVGYLQKSRILAESDLAQILAEFKARPTEGNAATLDDLTALLLSRRLLTPWHVNCLLRRKYKGFFIDEYLLLNHLSSSENSARFTAFDAKRQRVITLEYFLSSANYKIEEDFE